MANEENRLLINPNWRYASRTIKFWKFDYRIFFFLIIFLLHMRLYTLYLILAVAVFLYIIEVKYSYTLVSVFRRLSCFIAGKYKPSVSERRRNRTDR